MQIDTYILQGHIYGDLGKFKESADSFREAVKLEPDNIDFRSDLIIALSLSRQQNFALQELELLKKIDRKRAAVVHKMITKEVK